MCCRQSHGMGCWDNFRIAVKRSRYIADIVRVLPVHSFGKRQFIGREILIWSIRPFGISIEDSSRGLSFLSRQER